MIKYYDPDMTENDKTIGAYIRPHQKLYSLN